MPPLSANRNDKSMCDRLLVMWTKEEDDTLRDQVKLHGIDKWAKIAPHLSGKTSRQCRRRWHMFLNVVNKRGGWSADEDKLLLEAHRKFGNRWTEIAKKLPGRTDNAVKNRFCVLCKKQTKEAEIAPLQRCLNVGPGEAKQKVQERRYHEGPKLMHAIGGVNKKMRTGSILQNRTPHLGLPHRPLEDKSQQWNGLESCDVSTNSLHQHQSSGGSLQPWETMQSDVLLQQGSQEDRFHSWKRLPLKDTESPCHGELQQWERLESGAAVNSPVCPKSSLQGESELSNVVQSQVPTMSPPSQARLMQENLQQWKRSTSAEASCGRMHPYIALTKNHSLWCGSKSTDAAHSRTLQQGSVSGLLQWWKGTDVKDMSSDPALQKREIDEVLHQWEQNSQESVTDSLHHQRSVDENLPPLSEINSLGLVYVSSSKHSTLVDETQRWSTMQSLSQSEKLQQPSGDGVQSWGHHMGGADNNTSQQRSKDNVDLWQDWNSNEAIANESSCGDGPQECIMQTDDPKPENPIDSVSSQEASLKHLPEWTSSSCQEAPTAVVFHAPGHKVLQWKHSPPDTQAKSPLEDTVQQWDGLEAADSPGPILSILNRLSGSDSNVKDQPLSLHTEKQDGRYKVQVIEETWKTAVEKLKFPSTSFTADNETQSSSEDLEFEEYMPEETNGTGLKTVAVFSSTTLPPNEIWELKTDVKNGEPRQIHGLRVSPKHSTTSETSMDVCHGLNAEVELMKIDEQASGISKSPPPSIPVDGAHSPSEIIPRSHHTMECMPSPQFSDSEKEFLLSTLDQTTSNCWPSSPLRPQSRFSKTRNPLIDIRYDTPARSPLSSCLLRQFQVSEPSRLA